MLAKLKSAWTGLKSNPYHVIIALSMIGVGINLVFVPQPFVWPPLIRDVGNDHGFDIAFVVVGIMMLLWTVSRKHDLEWDAVNLGLAAFLMVSLTIYQFLHTAWIGSYMPWVQDAAILALIIILAVRSDADDNVD